MNEGEEGRVEREGVEREGMVERVMGGGGRVMEEEMRKEEVMGGGEEGEINQNFFIPLEKRN